MAPSTDFSLLSIYGPEQFSQALEKLEELLLSQAIHSTPEKPQMAPRPTARSAQVKRVIRKTISEVMSTSASLSSDQYSVDATIPESFDSAGGFIVPRSEDSETPMCSTPRQSTSCFRRFQIDDSSVDVSLTTNFAWGPPLTLWRPDNSASSDEEGLEETVIRLNVPAPEPRSNQIPLGRFMYLPDTPCPKRRGGHELSDIGTLRGLCLPSFRRTGARRTIQKRFKKLGCSLRRRLFRRVTPISAF